MSRPSRGQSDGRSKAQFPECPREFSARMESSRSFKGRFSDVLDILAKVGLLKGDERLFLGVMLALG